MRTRSLWNAGTEGAPERTEREFEKKKAGLKVRSGTHRLPTNLRLMKNEASPLSLAEARSSIFFFVRWVGEGGGVKGAARGAICPVTLNFSRRPNGKKGRLGGASLPAWKAGFSVPAASTLAGKISGNINKNTQRDTKEGCGRRVKTGRL